VTTRRRRILAVCLGNICRSPTAEAAIRAAAAAAGVDVVVDSAGIGAWHVGNPPDPRMVAAAEAAGLEIAGTARQVTEDDFRDFDLIVAMDDQNLGALRKMRPADATAELALFRSFDPDAGGREVPDPYYGGEDGFREVVEMVRAAARGLVSGL
jgi:protein-tyrosine phosphatase